MKPWTDCKRILCIRPDNMGDLIMSGPAIRALKESFNAEITVLTSSMGAGITRFMPEVDKVIVADLPWVKNNSLDIQIEDIANDIKKLEFDAAVMFTVFSQNPLPTAMLTYMAGIPRVLAYCRENPYHLIPDWVVDDEPYQIIRHQVQRDLRLVEAIGAKASDDYLRLSNYEDAWPVVNSKLNRVGVDTSRPFILMHIAASESKRLYPVQHWAEVANKLLAKGYQLLLTGSVADIPLVNKLRALVGAEVFNLAGVFDLGEFICLINRSALLLSVNTGTVHIASAVGTPVVVLYAQTNPQHTPWKVPHKVLEFPVTKEQRSRNEVVAYLNRTIYADAATMPTPNGVVQAAEELLAPKTLTSQLFLGKLHGNQD